MPKSTIRRHPSLEGSASVGETGPLPLRPSLYNHKDVFIDRISPFATAAIYFGSFSLAPEDSSLARQALFKLSFAHRHFLHPGGLRIIVDKNIATFSGTVSSPILLVMADILAHQIEGIDQVKNTTTTSAGSVGENEKTLEAVQFLFATDQTLRSGVQISATGNRLTLEGQVRTTAQKNWAEQLAAALGNEVDSKLNISAFTPPPMSPASQPPQVEDESLQTLVLFRLRLIRETEHLPVKVKANRGIVILQGKVRSEALRQRVENIARSTLGVRELRSSLSITS